MRPSDCILRYSTVSRVTLFRGGGSTLYLHCTCTLLSDRITYATISYPTPPSLIFLLSSFFSLFSLISLLFSLFFHLLSFLFFPLIQCDRTLTRTQTGITAAQERVCARRDDVCATLLLGGQIARPLSSGHTVTR